MVRRKGSRRKHSRKTASKKVVGMGGKSYVCKPVKGGRIKYKKCILSKIRGTKITSAKGARKAFNAAAKKCRPLLTGVKKRARKGRGVRRVVRRARRAARRMGLPTAWRTPGRLSSRRRMRSLPTGMEKFLA